MTRASQDHYNVILNFSFLADGSARFSQGATAVLVGIHGPSAIAVAREDNDKATVDVIVQRPSGIPSGFAYIVYCFFSCFFKNLYEE